MKKSTIKRVKRLVKKYNISYDWYDGILMEGDHTITRAHYNEFLKAMGLPTRERIEYDPNKYRFVRDRDGNTQKIRLIDLHPRDNRKFQPFIIYPTILEKMVIDNIIKCY